MGAGLDGVSAGFGARMAGAIESSGTSGGGGLVVSELVRMSCGWGESCGREAALSDSMVVAGSSCSGTPASNGVVGSGSDAGAESTGEPPGTIMSWVVSGCCCCCCGITFSSSSSDSSGACSEAAISRG
jgi:hypothetical protein